MSYIKEKYADQIGSKMTLDDVSGMKRAGPLQPSKDDDDSWLEDTYIEDFTMPNLKKILDERIVGQEQAKKALAQTLYTTFEHNMATNVMLIGPTASVKQNVAEPSPTNSKKHATGVTVASSAENRIAGMFISQLSSRAYQMTEE